MSDIETRVAIIETKIDAMEQKVLQHEAKTERLFEKMSDTLDDIKKVLQQIVIANNNITNEVNSIKSNARISVATTTKIGAFLTVVFGALYTLIKDWVQI